jgi:Xaa-Pro dipeptidase
MERVSDHVIEQNMVFDMLLPTIYRPGVRGPRLTDTPLVTINAVESLTPLAAGMPAK